MSADLYWIDDDMSELITFKSSIFPIIWDNNYSFSIFLFGNAYCVKSDEKGPDEEDCKEFAKELDSVFRAFCQDLDDKDYIERGTNYKSKRRLIDECKVTRIPLNNINEEGLDDIARLVLAWMDKNKLEELKSKSEENITLINEHLKDLGMLVDPLIERLAIPPKSAVALDLYLLFDDPHRLNLGLPTLSMAIYYTLTQNKYRCFRYSSAAEPQWTFEKWVEIYKSVFSPDCSELVYSKNALFRKNQDVEAENALIEMLKEGGDIDNGGENTG